MILCPRLPSQVLQRAPSLPAACLLVSLVGVGTLHVGLRRRHPITSQNLRERQRLSRVRSGTSNNGNFRFNAAESSGRPRTRQDCLRCHAVFAFPTCEQGCLMPQSFPPTLGWCKESLKCVRRSLTDLADACVVAAAIFWHQLFILASLFENGLRNMGQGLVDAQWASNAGEKWAVARDLKISLHFNPNLSGYGWKAGKCW